MEDSQSKIRLSHFTIALLDRLQGIKAKPNPDEFSRLTVSQTATFFALVYEKIRNVVEYREAHLIRRAAVERILRRRLLLNPSGKGEGENVVRELLWARYFPQDKLGQEDVMKVQAIIDKYIAFKPDNTFTDYLTQLLSCEIEETLSPDDAQRADLETFFLFQVLKNKVKIDNVSDEQKDAYFYVALEKIFNKSDLPYLRYHLLKLQHESLSEVTPRQIKEFERIEKLIKNPYSARMRRFIKNQIPPFKILFQILKTNKNRSREILSDKKSLWKQVEETCKEKYTQSGNRLRQLAIKSIIYIFLTKMIFALILEYPVSLYLFGEVNYTALIINSIFPPLLMFIVVALSSVPGYSNTTRVFERVMHIIDADKSFETSISFVIRKKIEKKPTLKFAFTVFYIFTFVITFLLLHAILSLLKFNALSETIFIFFVSLVAFFSHRVRAVAKEYRLREKESFISPFTDFFAVPFLTVGKFLSSSISRLNFLAALLDFLIEAPFKLIIEVVEEWISFVRSRKDEIA